VRFVCVRVSAKSAQSAAAARLQGSASAISDCLGPSSIVTYKVWWPQPNDILSKFRTKMKAFSTNLSRYDDAEIDALHTPISGNST
jgi:hypothetical protein